MTARTNCRDRSHLPGGGPGPGETIEQALLREVREVLGIRSWALPTSPPAEMEASAQAAASGRRAHSGSPQKEPCRPTQAK
ncbi:NUDIX domain-containing protein [Streptomyces sp. NPDC004728]|uniref:NUDIX domain-containing protein n=1 Tax=Streptomyces sp. NPDC004728 TaxID=3154289 RepID=UPI0033AA2014